MQFWPRITPALLYIMKKKKKNKKKKSLGKRSSFFAGNTHYHYVHSIFTEKTTTNQTKMKEVDKIYAYKK